MGLNTILHKTKDYTICDKYSLDCFKALYLMKIFILNLIKAMYGFNTYKNRLIRRYM